MKNPDDEIYLQHIKEAIKTTGNKNKINDQYKPGG